jgi:hypothetical protein
MDKFKWTPISLEQYKQMCRFLKEPYYPGDYDNYSIQQGFAQFKRWHKRQMDKRDAKLKTLRLKQ